MADTNTEAPQAPKPVESVPEEKEEGIKAEGAAETVKNTTAPVDSVFSMFGGGPKPKREEKEEEDDEPKAKAKKEDNVSSHGLLLDVCLRARKKGYELIRFPATGGGSPRVP